MKQIKFWLWIVLFMGMTTLLGESLIYSVSPGLADVFPQSIE